MTDIIVGNRIVAYEGFLAEIILGEKRQVKSLMIRNPRRFLVKVKDDLIETQGDKYDTGVQRKSHGVDVDVPHYQVMLFKEENIKNVVFNRYKIQGSISSEEDVRAYDYLDEQV